MPTSERTQPAASPPAIAAGAKRLPESGEPATETGYLTISLLTLLWVVITTKSASLVP